MVKFIIVRHGYSVSNLNKTITGYLDVPLTELGEKQGEAVSQYIFDNYKIDAIYSSDLIRAVSTIKKLSSLTGLPINKQSSLREVCCGEWEGVLISDVIKEYGEIYEKWRLYDKDIAPKGGETFLQLKNRAFSALEQIAKDNDGKQIVITSHGALIKVVQCTCLGLEWEQFRDIPYLPNAAFIELDYDGKDFNKPSKIFDEHLSQMRTEMPKGF